MNKEPKESKEYLTSKDIEELLGLSHTTVSKLINTKGFPVIRIGRSVRVKASELDKFLETYKTHRINL